MTGCTRDERGSARGVALGVLAALVLSVLLAVVACLTFSVHVVGNSMEPTLKQGDRLEVNPFGTGTIERFDIVETIRPNGGAPVVKRVIALPGDQVSIDGDQDLPAVLVRPAGSPASRQASYRVDSDAWQTTYDHQSLHCCDSQGRGSGTAGWATVPADSYWVLGDNWSASTDSRSFGWIRKADVQAKVWFRILPATSFGNIPSPVRLVPAS